MSYISLLKNIPEILTQPTGIAAIASLGIHGAIALIVPLMPVDSNQSAINDSAKAVGLMELSPSDQNRLPQSQPSQVALLPPAQQQQIPSINFGNEQAITPPIEPAIPGSLPGSSVLPPIPTSSAYNISSLPKRQPIPRFTRNDFSTQFSNFRVRNTFPSSQSPFVDDIDAKIRQTQALNINNLPEVQADNKLPSEPLINPSADAIDVGSTDTPQGVAESQKIQLPENPVQISANSSPVLSPQPVVIGKEQLQQNVPATPSPEASASQGNNREQLLAKLDSYNTLRQKIQAEYPNIKEQGVIRQTISTNKIEGTVLGRLIVDADGKVLDIKFQDGSSPELQSKTREFFNANPLKGENRISSYPFQLKFTNNVDKKTQDLKPLSTQQFEAVSEPQPSKNQPNNQSVVIPNPSSTPVVSNDQPGVSTESPQKLIQKLRQIKEQQ